MTRTRNATFHGTDPASCDVDSPQMRDVLKEIAQDIHLTYDKVTGENGISAGSTVNHDGTSLRGSLLGVPVVNQMIGKTITMSRTDAATYGGEIYLWGAPVFISAGEGSYGYHFRVGIGLRYHTSVLVYDSSGTLETQVDLSFYENTNEMGVFLSLTDGLKYFLVQTSYATGTEAEFYFSHVTMYKAASPDQSSGLYADTASINTIEFEATTAGGSATSIRTLHDEYFQTEYPIASYILKKMHYACCKLFEYITGAPVIGNSVVTDDDSSDNDPTTSRYMASTRSVFTTTEPLIDWPMGSWGLGAVQVDGTNTTNSAATAGFDDSDWFAPFVNDTISTDVVFYEVTGRCPDFPTASNLKCAILMCGVGSITGETTRVELSGGTTVTASSTTAFAPFNVYHITGVDFDPDIINTWRFIHNKGAKLFVMDESNVLGVCLYFEP